MIAILPLVFFAFMFFHVPASAPVVVYVAPLAASPATEARAVNPAVFRILEHAFASIGITDIDAEHFEVAAIRVDAENAVTGLNLEIAGCQLLKAAGNVNVAALGTVLRAKDEEFAGVLIVVKLPAVGAVIVSAMSPFPSAIPIFVAPVSAFPPAELSSVKDGAVGEIERAFVAIALAGKDPKNFRPPGSGIGTHGVGLDAEPYVLARQFPQTMRYVYMTVLGAVLRVKNDITAGVAIAILAIMILTIVILGRKSSEQYADDNR